MVGATQGLVPVQCSKVKQFVRGELRSPAPAKHGASVMCLLAVLVALFALAAAPASAKTIHEFTNSFGTPVSDTTLSLVANSGLAVNETSHNIYVADTGNHRIVEFSSAGVFIRAFGADVGGAGVDVCASGCQAGTAGTAPGSFESPTFLAIDNSGGASNGDIYIVDSATHLVSKFEADGTLVSSWGTGGQLDGSSAPGGPFGEIAGIAVGPDGELAVFEVEPQRLFIFEEDGTFISEVETPRGSAALGLSRDGEGNFYKVNGDQTIHKFAPSGASIGQISEGAPATGLAVNTDSDVLYVDLGTSINVYVFNGAGEVVSPAGSCAPQEFIGCPTPTERFGEGALGQGGALAVDGSDDTVYAVDVGASTIVVFTAFSLPDVVTGVAEVKSTDTATLNGEVNPNEITLEECFFEYGETTAYGATTPCENPDAEEVGTGSSFVPVHADLTNLTPGVTYHYRLVAGNSNGTNSESGDQEFFTGPSVLSAFATDVSSITAILNAEINPHGIATTYRFQYVPDSAFQLSGYATAAEVPGGGETIGSGTATVSRSVQLRGLTPSTTYHFRVLVENALGTVVGPDRTLTTQLGGLGFQLPDHRVWELVSPPDKHGARLVGGGEYHLQASADGNGLAYQSYLSTEADPEGNRIIEPSMNLARRRDDGSWQSKDITPPNEYVTRPAAGNGGEYKLFNSDLSEALVEPRSGTALSPEASPERTPYLRENTEPPAYKPLVTNKEPYANVPFGTELGGGLDSTGRPVSIGAVRVIAASPDFRHFGLLSKVPLVDGAPAAEGTLYEWTGGQIQPVSVLPAGDGGAIVAASIIGSESGSVDGALSRDGSRVFWTSQSPAALYLRYNATEAASVISGGECTEPAKACTVRIDVKQPTATGAGSSSPVFQGASADGTVVFFTDSQQLTEDASDEGADLYRCELPVGSVANGCASLTNISAPTEVDEDAEVQGIAAAVSEDGTKVYFVAKGVLDEAPNELGDSALSGQPNFYVWQQDEGVRFIATLADEDFTDWGYSPSFSTSLAGALTATASPSGRYLSFMSQRSLTGYDNHDESSGKAAQEVFRYDATTEELQCVSCGPTGARPHSAVPSQAYRAFVDPWNLWQGRLVAAALPEATAVSLLSRNATSLYRPRSVLDNGRVFFNAIDSLAPADSNGQWDVYQYESTGIGDCNSAMESASPSSPSGGCISLISSGTAEEEAAFFDADETGDNAFFWTPAQLSVLDEDHEVDIYDARVNGVAATRVLSTECLGEACRSSSQTPNDLTPASAILKGAGNLHPRGHKRCPKGKRQVRRHGRVRCAAKKHRRASGDRRSGR
jgi:NHL repeat